MSVTHSPASQEDDPTDNQPTQNNPAPETTQTTPPPPTTCSCPTSPPSSEPGTDAQHAALISADIDAGASGIQANIDALGHDVADVAIGLGAVDSVLALVDSKLGLVDGGSNLVDGLLCDVV